MMEQARKRFKFAGLVPTNLKLLDQGNLQFPYNSNTFDIVLCESVLSILPLDEIKENLTEIRRVLKPGGILAMNESIWLESILSLIHILKQIKKKATRYVPSFLWGNQKKQ